MNNKISEIINKYESKREALIQMLQDINHEYKYLPEKELRYLSKKLSVPLSEIYGISTFYKSFSLKPRGKHSICVCTGTACHVKGAAKIVEKIQMDLGVKPGETTDDLKYTFETVNCLGACALAPLVVVDGEYHGQMDLAKISRLLKKLEKEDLDKDKKE